VVVVIDIERGYMSKWREEIERDKGKVTTGVSCDGAFIRWWMMATR